MSKITAMRIFQYFFTLLILFSVSNLQSMPRQNYQDLECECNAEKTLVCVSCCALVVICCCTEVPKELWKSAKMEFNRPSYIPEEKIMKDPFSGKCYKEKRTCRFGLRSISASPCRTKKVPVHCPHDQKMR